MNSAVESEGVAPRRAPCKRYVNGESFYRNGLVAGRYLAAVQVGTLPKEHHADYRIVRRGYAVGIGNWYFFDAREPAVAFARAARMSLECHGCGAYEAAHETVHCLDHGDERVLLVGKSIRGEPDEAEVLKRFVRGVEEHQDSSYWHPPAA